MKIQPDKPFRKRECPGCAMEVPENNNYCPICGYAFPHPTPRQKYMKWVGAILMLVLFVVVLLGIF